MSSYSSLPPGTYITAYQFDSKATVEFVSLGLNNCTLEPAHVNSNWKDAGTNFYVRGYAPPYSVEGNFDNVAKEMLSIRDSQMQLGDKGPVPLNEMDE